ncbi:hypothetical protein ACFXKC_18055 [Streptomyces sp. NPDC059340]|uniref:hypothetical protein n=1 Tax=Streptomyces sp. NPDC059340 TaxID=3346806 RepID=UPI0036CC852E
MTTDDLPARLEAVLTERFTELGNPFSAMRRHEKGPDGWPASHPVGPHQVAEVLRELLAAAPVPPPALTNRAALTRVRMVINTHRTHLELTDPILLAKLDKAVGPLPADGPSRMAVEAPAPNRADDETRKACGCGQDGCEYCDVDEEQPESGACTCAVAGDCFAPAGHYADCPQAEQPAAVSQPVKEPTS